VVLLESQDKITKKFEKNGEKSKLSESVKIM